MTTGVTIGRATGIESFVREGEDKTSMAVTVYPYSHRDGPFSARGDSGSIIVDGRGRIVGLLIGGVGATGDFDVTYLTPYFWIEEHIKNAFPTVISSTRSQQQHTITSRALARRLFSFLFLFLVKIMGDPFPHPYPYGFTGSTRSHRLVHPHKM